MAIRKDNNGKWVVTDRTGKRILGRHETKKAAQKQLAAIEAQKSKKHGAKRRA